MAEYQKYKSKRFKLQKEAIEWTKGEKKKIAKTMKVRIETNYKAGEPFPWEGVVLTK